MCDETYAGELACGLACFRAILAAKGSLFFTTPSGKCFDEAVSDTSLNFFFKNQASFLLWPHLAYFPRATPTPLAELFQYHIIY